MLDKFRRMKNGYGWRMPEVLKRKMDVYSGLLVGAIKKFQPYRSRLSNPRTLTHNQRIVCSIGSAFSRIRSFLVSAPYRDGGDGIDDKNGKTEQFKSKRRLVYQISLCVAGYLAMAIGWCRLRLCRCKRDLCLGIAGLFIGFPISVWGGLLWADMIFGVF